MKLPLLSGLILTVLLGGAILSGCKKNNESVNSRLTGGWKLVLYSEGFSGRVILTHADSVYLLSMDGTDYKKTLNGNVYESGAYHISNVKNIYDQNVTGPAVVFGGVNYPLPQLIELRSDTLFLTMNAIDGNAFEYVKLKAGAGTP
ncbi:MAG TPA: hypothetical protein VE035_09230 [Puia sp.]|nr:hypothetical protein [Puia sp.]